MFKRLIDVLAVKADGTSLVLVNHQQEPNSFVCVGSIERLLPPEVDKLTLSIYNLPAATRGLLLLGGYSTIIVRYGYKYSQNDQETLNDLFIGNIQRVTYTREDAVTDVTNIWAYDNGDFKNYGFFGNSYVDGINLYEIAQDILENGTVSPESYELSETLKKYYVNGSMTVYGAANEALQDLANKAGLVYKSSDGNISILDPEEVMNPENAILYSYYNEGTNSVESASGLVGIPSLNDDGLSFESLVNTQLRLHSFIKLDNSIISIAQEGAIPENELGATLDPDGLYVVVKISVSFTNNENESKMTVKALSRSLYSQLYSAST